MLKKKEVVEVERLSSDAPERLRVVSTRSPVRSTRDTARCAAWRCCCTGSRMRTPRSTPRRVGAHVLPQEHELVQDMATNTSPFFLYCT
jgi:hypothetical protein